MLESCSKNAALLENDEKICDDREKMAKLNGFTNNISLEVFVLTHENEIMRRNRSCSEVSKN